jgi:hypothetical protein
MSMKKYWIFNVRDYNFVNFWFNKLPKDETYVNKINTSIIKELIHYVYSYYYIYII